MQEQRFKHEIEQLSQQLEKVRGMIFEEWELYELVVSDSDGIKKRLSMILILETFLWYLSVMICSIG